MLESFQSIYKKPSVLFKGDKEEMEVNRVIDNLIDDGYLVPTYERVSNNDNTFYWRRFFRPTHTIISLLEDNTSTFDIK